MRSFIDWHQLREGWWQDYVSDPQNREYRRNDPRGKNAPRTINDAMMQVMSGNTVKDFADSLGIPTSLRDQTLLQALARIAVARIYGLKYGIVTEADLAHIWKVLQTERKGKTLAQLRGLTRPLAIVGKVPGAYPDQLWHVEPEARQFDQQVREKQAVPAMQQQSAPPQPGTTPMQSSSTPSPLAGIPGPRTRGGRAALQLLNTRIGQLQALPTPNPDERNELQVLLALRTAYRSRTP